MSRRTANLGERCPVRTAIAVLGGKWKPLILYYLREDAKRFSQLRRAIPEATQQVLTQQLRELEEDGIIARTVYPVVPPKVEYDLTALGRRLEPILELLERWGDELIQTVERGAFNARSIDAAGGQPAPARASGQADRDWSPPR